jgi:hypothetical protein
MNAPGSTFHATQDPGTGKITILKSPACDGCNNTFEFKRSAEMRTTLNLQHDPADIESILQELADSGSADFTLHSAPSPDSWWWALALSSLI